MKISAFGRSWRNGVMTTASSLALCALATQPAFAQDAAEEAAAAEEAEPEGDIVVTGYRKALETAQTLKRDSDTFVDVLSAEDIGALADRSVADWLAGLRSSKTQPRTCLRAISQVQSTL